MTEGSGLAAGVSDRTGEGDGLGVADGFGLVFFFGDDEGEGEALCFLCGRGVGVGFNRFLSLWPNDSSSSGTARACPAPTIVAASRTKVIERMEILTCMSLRRPPPAGPPYSSESPRPDFRAESSR